MSALSPAEALVLLEPEEAPGMDAVKVTVLSLLARGHLRSETKTVSSFLRGSRAVPMLTLGQRYPVPVPRHVGAVLDVVRTAGDPAMPKIAEGFIKAFGQKCARFRPEHVLPDLISRRLLERKEWTERKKFLGLIPRTVTRVVHARTPAGEAECTRIRQAITEARSIPGFLSTDPARAAAMAVALGALIFLVPELVPYYQQLSAEMQRANAAAMAQGGSDSSGSDSSGSDSGGSDGGGDSFLGGDSAGATMQLNDFGAALSFDQAFDALSDSLDAAMDAADSSASSDGGSDGGGSDGGGGGGE